MYWTIVFLILACGAAIPALATDHYLALTGQVLLALLVFAFFSSLLKPLLGRKEDHLKQHPQVRKELAGGKAGRAAQKQ